MRWDSRTAMRCALLVGTAWCLPGLWSCGGNEETTVYETLYDTLRIHDTTVVWDTLFDTMYVAPGRSDMVLFGIVYDVSAMHTDTIDTSKTFDSVYVGLTCFANPARQDLRVLVNGDSVRREDAEREIILRMVAGDLYYGVPFPAVNMGALLDGTLWEDFLPAGAPYLFEVVVPVPPVDTASPVTYDTARGTATIPRPATGVLVSSNAGSHPRTYNAILGEDCYPVPGDSAITLTWDDSADYYVVSVYKYAYNAMYGYYVADTPYDTIVTASVCRLPRGELSRSSVQGGYYVAQVNLIGINGPEPASWDTLPSFGSRGILVAFNAENDYELLVPQGSPLLAKSLAVEAVLPPEQDALAAVCRALRLSPPR